MEEFMSVAKALAVGGGRNGAGCGDYRPSLLDKRT